MTTPIVKPPTSDQLRTQVRYLEAEVERLRIEIKTETAKKLVANVEIERMRVDRAKLIDLLAQAREPQGESQERVAEWLRSRGYTVTAALEPKP
jgi:hypothetical protein